MATQFIIQLSALLPIIGYGIFAILWFPTRKTKTLSSIGWILLATLVSYAGGYLMAQLSKTFSASPAPPSLAAATLIKNAAISILFINGLSTLLKSWMIAANAAFLLDESARQSPAVRFFSRQHSQQTLFGILLVACSAMPFLILLIQSLLGFPPHFN